jgi:hypothetical protein
MFAMFSCEHTKKGKKPHHHHSAFSIQLLCRCHGNHQFPLLQTVLPNSHIFRNSKAIVKLLFLNVSTGRYTNDLGQKKDKHGGSEHVRSKFYLYLENLKRNNPTQKMYTD